MKKCKDLWAMMSNQEVFQIIRTEQERDKFQDRNKTPKIREKYARKEDRKRAATLQGIKDF